MVLAQVRVCVPCFAAALGVVSTTSVLGASLLRGGRITRAAPSPRPIVLVKGVKGPPHIPFY
jgi:hypothetical protein